MTGILKQMEDRVPFCRTPGLRIYPLEGHQEVEDAKSFRECVCTRKWAAIPLVALSSNSKRRP